MIADPATDPQTPPPNPRKRLWFVLRLVLGLSTFGLLFVFCHPAVILAELRNADPLYLALGFAMCLLVMLVRASRWWLILRDLNMEMSFGRVIRTYAVSYWFNTFLPGSVGGDLYKVYDLSRVSSKKLRPIATIFVERVTGVLALLTIALIADIFFGRRMNVPGWVQPGLILLFIGGLVGFFVVPRYFARIYTFLAIRIPLVRRLLSEKHIEIIDTFSEEMCTHPFLFIRSYLFGLALQMIVLVTYAVIAAALEKPIPFVFFFIFFPIVEVASMVPLTINGLGVREGLLALFLQYADVDSSFALSMSILYRAILLVLALLGGLVLVTRMSRPAPDQRPGDPPVPAPRG